MKTLALALLLGLGAGAFAAEMQPQDAYGYCYHFYNCQGIYFSGGFYSVSDCQAMGGLSVQEGSYCENVSPSEGVKATAVKPMWFGNCYSSIGCIGLSFGSMGDSQCQAMGGHSMDVGGGACIEL